MKNDAVFFLFLFLIGGRLFCGLGYSYFKTSVSSAFMGIKIHSIQDLINFRTGRYMNLRFGSPVMMLASFLFIFPFIFSSCKIVPSVVENKYIYLQKKGRDSNSWKLVWQDEFDDSL